MSVSQLGLVCGQIVLRRNRNKTFIHFKQRKMENSCQIYLRLVLRTMSLSLLFSFSLKMWFSLEATEFGYFCLVASGWGPEWREMCVMGLLVQFGGQLGWMSGQVRGSTYLERDCCVDDMSIQSWWIKESTTQNPYKLVLKIVFLKKVIGARSLRESL